MSPAEKALPTGARPPSVPPGASHAAACLGTPAELVPTRSLERLIAAFLPWQAEPPSFWVLLHRPCGTPTPGHPPRRQLGSATLPWLVFLQARGRPVV